MTLFAIIGEGPNGLEIPLVMFPNKEQADAFVEQFPKHPKIEGWLDEDFSDVSGIYFCDDVNEGGDENYHSPQGRDLYNKLFKEGDYYSGCGGCYKLLVREITFGQPIVGWDLD